MDKNSEIKITVTLPTTSELFKKHFNDMGIAGLQHPNAESFWEELNQVCLIEDSLKQISNVNNTINTN